MAALIFIWGLLIGSFLNVCVYRLPRGESVVSPPSHCPRCGARLRWYDLIPVWSYLALRGRCRACGETISWRYPLVELATAALFLWCYGIWGWQWELARALILSAFLLTIAIMDVDCQLILDRVLLWLGAAGLAWDALGWYGALAVPRPADAMAGALAGGGLLLTVAVLSHGGLGGGDVKCAAALGLWLGWRLTLTALFFAVVLGGGTAAVLLVLRLKSCRDAIPFGPFLAAGTFLAMLYGRQVWQWYVTNFF